MARAELGDQGFSETAVRVRVDEYMRARGEPGDDPLRQVEAALYVEEVFGVVLSDADMSADALGAGESMVALVLSRLPGGG